jgi:uncharacterized protein (DUF58 family)
VRRRLGVHPWGDERSTQRGPGVEYADVREYVLGDDARQIDWNLTARSDRTYIRESNPERGYDAWLLVDASRSLDWGTSDRLKRDSARQLVESMTLLLSRYGNRVGAVVFDTAVRAVLPPASGRTGRLRLLARLDRELAAPGGDGRTDLRPALQLMGRVGRRSSLVIVVSDLMVAGGWQRPLRMLAQRHEVVVARISDPREGELPDIGLVTFEDPETGQQFEVDTSSRKLRQRFLDAAREERAQLAKELGRLGAATFEVGTNAATVEQLAEFLRRRQAELRSAGRPTPA